MSGYILCQTKKAEVPYYIENISTNIYSLEELCYYLYHNLYLVDSSVINENLCVWISEQLELPRLAAKIRPHLGKFASAEDVLYPIFKEINYLTYEELKALNVRLAKWDQEAPVLREKRKGDALVENRMYVNAIRVYQKLSLIHIFYYMCYKPQIVLYENAFCFCIALSVPLKIVLLLGQGQRF